MGEHSRPRSIRQTVNRLLRITGARSGLATAAITVGVAGLYGAQPAFAADAAADAAAGASDELQEVVVTAQFRQQSAQTTPIAITAVTGQQLDDRSLTNVTSLNGVAPNVNITAGTATNGPVAQIFIRGIGQSDGHPGLEPGVGLYVDDVYHGIMLGSEMDLTDLDRIEVLRGPQGTLAGKNSIGGAIKLYSKKPDDNTDGYAEVGYGSFNRMNLRAGGNFTLVEDKLFVRVSATSKSADGYMTRLDYGCVNPAASGIFQGGLASGCKLGTEGGQDLHAARVALRWIPNDNIENNLIASVTADRSEVPALKLLYSNNTQKYPNGQPYIPGGGSQFITGPNSYTTYATYGVLRFTDPPNFNGQPGAGTHAAVSLPTTNPTNYYGLSDTFTWKLAENYSLTAITGYLRYDGAFVSEIGDSPYPTQVLDDTWSERQFTEEVRLNGTSFSLLDWTVGGYYYNEHALFGGLKLLSPGLVSESLFTGNDPITSESKSGLPARRLPRHRRPQPDCGVRYTSESKDYTFQRLNPYDAAVPSYNAVGLLNGTTGTYSGNHTDYRAGLEYQWSPALMTYAQYSTGYRGGGVNPRPVHPPAGGPVQARNPAHRGGRLEEPPVRPEPAAECLGLLQQVRQYVVHQHGPDGGERGRAECLEPDTGERRLLRHQGCRGGAAMAPDRRVADRCFRQLPGFQADLHQPVGGDDRRRDAQYEGPVCPGPDGQCRRAIYLRAGQPGLDHPAPGRAISILLLHGHHQHRARGSLRSYAGECPPDLAVPEG